MLSTMDRLKRWLILALSILLVVGCVIPGYADELDKLREQQKEISRKIQEYRRYIANKNIEIKDLNQQLAALDRAITQAETKLAALKDALKLAEADLAQAEKELAQAQAEQKERLAILEDRLRAIYKNGSVTSLEVLLQAASFTDFLVRYDLLQRIAEQDVVLLREIEARRLEIEARKADLEVKRAHIASLKNQAEEQKAILEERQEEKAVLLAAAKEQKERAERALAAEEEASRQLAAKIRQMEARLKQKPFVGGRFTWPLPGYYTISSDYGWRVHPILGGRRFHAGIDIPAPEGTPVVAAAAGEVIFAGWYGGYGNAVVISHGGNITTTYAHLSRLSVSEGAKVAAGDEVGRVGDTGLSTGAHLHFDVREGGEPVNPWSYLR